MLLGISLTVVNAKVTFKVVAVDGTPSVVINNKKYAMKLLDYPVYQAEINVNAPVKYHYSLNINGKTQEEKFTRQAKTSETLNEFFDRSVTVKQHPLLPKVYETPSSVKQSKLYDDKHVGTFIIRANESNIKKLHSNPEKEGLKVNVEVIYVNPYTIKKFPKAKLAVSGQSTVHAKKLSYKISGLKTSDDKELYGRSSVKLRAEHMDPSFMRDKIYGDILNTLGVPSIQNTFVRLYINKQPIGLFDMTDDINSGHFLKNTFNAGEKYTVDNAVFKADYYPSGGAWGDLGYYGKSSRMYDIYYYKGDKEDFDNDDMVRDILIPFIYDASKYPSTKKLNFDIKSFLKQMAVEYAAGAMDNYWLRPGNYYIFKDMKKKQWSFIDCDFHYSLGLSGNGDANKMLIYTIKNYTKYNKKLSTNSRPLLDNIRKISSNESFFMDVFKNLVKYSFNINALGPRIDSLADLIREDAYWDLKLPRVNALKGRKLNDYGYTYKDFEAQVKNTSISSSKTDLFPLKYWIIKRSQSIASQVGVSIPKSLTKTSLGYYSNVSDTPKNSNAKSTAEKNTNIAKNDTPKKDNSKASNERISNNGRCGASFGKCPNNECCSQYGYCGTTTAYCGAKCQSQFGRCNGTSSSSNNTNAKKSNATNSKNVKVSTVSGRCGSSYGKCAGSKECCSKYNYCGKSADYCGTGCQPRYGLCH